MMSPLSVIICTYNPEITTINQCLLAIKKATQLAKPLEIILIDNNSNNQFIEDESFKLLVADLGITIINEAKQGLTPARLRGIQEAKGDLLIFIDDDNFISHNFFSETLRIGIENPQIGSFSGQVFLLYEVEPEYWVHKYSGLLVKRELEKSVWSNVYTCYETVPCGAGLVVRKSVANYYFKLHMDGKRPIPLDRNKDSLLSGGDNDLAYCALDIGMGMGLFKELSLQHYIPKNRITIEYLTALAKWIEASGVVLNWYRTGKVDPMNFRHKVKNIYHRLTKNKIDRLFHKATLDGVNIGISIIEKHLAN